MTFHSNVMPRRFGVGGERREDKGSEATSSEPDGVKGSSETGAEPQGETSACTSGSEDQ
jgi:hypothetical protein